MDISILKYLDIFIGFVLVMALASAFVTLLTQAWLSWTKKRAEILEQGIAALLKRAEPSLGDQANDIAKAVVEWSPASGKPGGKRDLVMREQLVRILLEIMTDPNPPKEYETAKNAITSLFIDEVSIEHFSVNQTAKIAIANLFSDEVKTNPLISQLENPNTVLQDAEKQAIKRKLQANTRHFNQNHDLSALLARLDENRLEPKDRENIRKLLILIEIASINARELLQTIDHKASELEAKNPELASHVVHAQAIIEANAGKFVDAIMMRFDSMSESLKALFTSHSRIVTFVISLIVAVFLPLDTIDLLQRLATDDKLRATLVTTAMEVSKTNNIECNQPQKEPKSGTATGEAPKKTSTGDQQSPLSTTTKPENDLIDCQSIKKAWADLNEPKLGLVTHEGWSNITDPKNQANSPFKSGWEAFKFVLGLFFSALLMTLGAPFWFDALKDLLKLRSSLAKTDDEAREARREDQTKAQS